MTFAAESNRIYDYAFCYLSVVSIQNVKICSVYAGRLIRVNVRDSSRRCLLSNFIIQKKSTFRRGSRCKLGNKKGVGSHLLKGRFFFLESMRLARFDSRRFQVDITRSYSIRSAQSAGYGPVCFLR